MCRKAAGTRHSTLTPPDVTDELEMSKDSRSGAARCTDELEMLKSSRKELLFLFLFLSHFFLSKRT